nr:PREDICTED: uncharacterized protein LOC102348876 [Latimeria chalumnae]|eukprot:XP_006011543.1 PREDICTED: uncharacterized protein LOC102348876 [Latimeria chalumnae]
MPSGSGVVYSEVNLAQCKSSSLPSIIENSGFTDSPIASALETRNLRLNTPPSTPPKLSPKLPNKYRASPAHEYKNSQKQEEDHQSADRLNPSASAEETKKLSEMRGFHPASDHCKQSSDAFVKPSNSRADACGSNTYKQVSEGFSKSPGCPRNNAYEKIPENFQRLPLRSNISNTDAQNTNNHNKSPERPKNTDNTYEQIPKNFTKSSASVAALTDNTYEQVPVFTKNSESKPNSTQKNEKRKRFFFKKAD